MPQPQLDNRSKELRQNIVYMLEKARRGHIGSAFSLIEILRVLYDDLLRFDPKKPEWEDRDRLILSKGHGCLALYSLLFDKGFIQRKDLDEYSTFNGILGGHPEYAKVPGVEASTGSLGHGLPMGAGMALAAKMSKKDFRVFVVMGDGECGEGSIWEAALFAAKHKLSNLTVLVDYNKQQCYGPTSEVSKLEPFADKWRSFGFATREVDGHSVEELSRTLTSLPLQTEMPTALICHTIKGHGVSFVAGNLDYHHKVKIKDEEIQAMMQELSLS